MKSKLSECINDNRELINKITPKNPTLKADDEWLEDNEWNRVCDEVEYDNV